MSAKQDKAKQRLIEQLKKYPVVEVACKKSGVARATFYRWRKADEEFAESVDEAIEESAGIINDLAEAQLITAIKNGNITAIFYWLNRRHPIYETRVRVDANVKHETQELTEEQAILVEQTLKNAGLLNPEGKDGTHK